MATSAQKKTSKKKSSKKSNVNNYVTPKNVTTYSLLVKKATDKYLKTIDPNDFNPQDVAVGLVNATCIEINSYNKANDAKWKLPADLLPYQIALILTKLHYAALIVLNSANISSDHAILAIYNTTGPNEGLYTMERDEFLKLAYTYKPTLTSKEFDEVLQALRSMAPLRQRSNNEDLIPVNNGVFDYRTKQFLKFSPNLVFTAKSHINFNPTAENVVLHNDSDNTDWDVESWMKSLSDDPQIVKLLWQTLGAIIRPNVSWDKSVWLYSTKGNNGKGTLCELMRNLCGPGTYAKLSLRDFSEDFLLEPLIRVSAIITDENDVGTYIDKAANLKAVETGDVITINRKYQAPVPCQFKGFMVQCLNEFPKVKDKSESFYRRQIFVPMNKSFKGIERKYIKQDYLHRSDVLEYVLKKLLLETNYYELDIPDVCKTTMEDYKVYNDPIREFSKEIVPNCAWDLLPFKFLYDLYIAWFKKNIPNGKPVSSRSFVSELREIYEGSNIDGFTCVGDGQTRTGNKMNQPEPMISEYNLHTWMNPNANASGDPNVKNTPITAERYRGLIRL